MAPTPISIMVPVRITIHCSASKNGVRWDVEEIRKFHTAPEPQGRGFATLGYHLVIQPDGEAQQGLPFNQVGCHVALHNTGNIGICLIGTDKFSGAQWQQLRYQIDALRTTYKIPAWEIWTHNQWDTAIEQKKVCPSVSINRIMAWYLERDMKAVAPFII